MGTHVWSLRMELHLTQGWSWMWNFRDLIWLCRDTCRHSSCSQNSDVKPCSSSWARIMEDTQFLGKETTIVEKVVVVFSPQQLLLILACQSRKLTLALLHQQFCFTKFFFMMQAQCTSLLCLYLITLEDSSAILSLLKPLLSSVSNMDPSKRMNQRTIHNYQCSLNA